MCQWGFRLLIHICFILLMILPAYADPPNWVYRFDGRDPNEIFFNGFRSWGDDDNIEHHVSGFSMARPGQAPSSAWIATASRLPDLMSFLRAAMVTNPSYRRMWVYRIRATDNFYEMNATLNDAALNDPDMENRDHAYALRARFSYQNEWGALGNIPGEQIMEATEYVWNEEQMEVQPSGRYMRNNAYVDSSTRANAGIYPFHGRRGHGGLTDRMFSIGRELVGALMFGWCQGGVARMTRDLAAVAAVTDACNNPNSMSYEYFSMHVVWCPSLTVEQCSSNTFDSSPYTRITAPRYIIHDEF